MRRLGVMGGSGAARLVPSGADTLAPARTPFGPADAPLRRWINAAGCEIWWLERHGESGAIAPHRVNYRANIWLMHSLGLDGLIGLNAVGGIDDASYPGRIVVPHQLIDYTWGRAHSFAGEAGFGRPHVDFTEPFDRRLRLHLLDLARATGIDCLDQGTYAAVQGPRLETAAEIDRLERDGATLVGMTGMPEAGLARETGLAYAMCALVVNRAAGRSRQPIHEEMARWLDAAVEAAGRLLDRTGASD
ncbi:MAG: S-methyl-5'-thioinosine phosphorylase [Chromatiales bacterium]|nr:S-methyl-5'-thioinosine phosphorylase [Chromatiales bacterium]